MPRRIVEVLVGNRRTDWVLGERIQPLSPDTEISITVGGEVQRVPVWRGLACGVFKREDSD